MQEIKKRRILLASVLKPVDDPRAFEKMGQSLAAAGYEVFIAGTSPSSEQTVDSITFLPHEKFERLSFSRIAIRFKILSTVFKLKPDLLIVSSHELLEVAFLYRLISVRKVVYDVRENYFRNILYTKVFPKLLRRPIASLVRLKEIFVSFFMSGFTLAEKCYEQELNFVRKNFCTVENKCKIPAGFVRKAKQDSFKFLFTGTLAESTGVFQAIEVTKRIHALKPEVSLEIVGFCLLPGVLKEIKRQIQSCSFISLKGGDHFVSHKEIFESVSSANFGIVSYPIMTHTKDKIPTKLYEYLACGLPMILQQNPVWERVAQPHGAAIVINFESFDAENLLEQVRKTTAFTPAIESGWASEEKRLLAFINGLLA